MNYPKFIKPLIDFIIASFVLLITSPVIIIVTLALSIVNKGKPFFIQARPGKNEKIFYLMKFKTMNDKIDENGQLLPDAKRMTKIGSIVRKTSLDELPQLVNVIKGDMSLVGPRPLLVSYLPLYDNIQKRRHEVKPGITGWAQINGRNAITWDKKFEYDVWYIDNISLLVDVKIMLNTFLKVFRFEGISQAGEATMETFTGNVKNS